MFLATNKGYRKRWPLLWAIFHHAANIILKGIFVKCHSRCILSW